MGREHCPTAGEWSSNVEMQGQKGDKLRARWSDRPKQVTMDRIFDKGA